MPAEPSRRQLERMLALVPWALARGDEATVDEACDRFGITREELLENLETLCYCGLPPFTTDVLVEAGVSGDRIVIHRAGWLSRPIRLTREEAVALVVTGRAIAAVEGLAEPGVLTSALDKLEKAVAPRDAGAVADLAERVRVEVEGAGTGMLTTLRDAIQQRRRLGISYYTLGRDQTTEREVDPLLVTVDRHWYLIAHDHRSGEERTFRIDRIREMRETGERFEPPAGFDPAHYDDGFAFAPSPDDADVTIDLAPEGAWIAEQAPCEREPLVGGGVRMRLRTSRFGWLVRLLLPAGRALRSVEPPELAAAVAGAASATLARYRG